MGSPLGTTWSLASGNCHWSTPGWCCCREEVALRSASSLRSAVTVVDTLAREASVLAISWLNWSLPFCKVTTCIHIHARDQSDRKAPRKCEK